RLAKCLHIDCPLNYLNSCAYLSVGDISFWNRSATRGFTAIVTRTRDAAYPVSAKLRLGLRYINEGCRNDTGATQGCRGRSARTSEACFVSLPGIRHDARRSIVRGQVQLISPKLHRRRCRLEQHYGSQTKLRRSCAQDVAIGYARECDVGI